MQERKQEIMEVAYPIPLRGLNILSYYGNYITQMMQSTEINIRICQPQKVMFTEAEPSLAVNITFAG